MNGANGRRTVTEWRDDVTMLLGRLDERTKTINNKLDDVCKKQKEHEQRIEDLEALESNRSAVQKKLGALYAAIIAIVTLAVNVAAKLLT